MERIHMVDIIPLIDIPDPLPERTSYNVPCPCCDTNPKKKHLNINLEKDVFRCPRCGFSGGVFEGYILSRLFDVWVYAQFPQWHSPEKYPIAYVCITIPIFIVSLLLGKAAHTLAEKLTAKKRTA